MPSRSLAQDRFVRAKAAQGASWAQKWIAEEHGMKIPHVQHVRKVKRRRKKVKRV